MSLPLFDPNPRPSPGAGHKRRLKLLDADFGDGYCQATPDGLNHVRKSVALKWDALTTIQMRSLDNFFVELGGTKPFLFQPFGETSPLAWICKEWTPESNAGIWTFTAVIEQSFSHE